jgi:phosphatidylglycerophosphate synthase
VNNPWPGVSFGAALVGIGISFLMSHVRSWRRQRGNPDLETAQRTFYERRFRRRAQIASLLIIIGVLLGVGDLALSVPPFNRTPLLAAILLGSALLLTVWVVLLAFAEFWSTVANARAELARVDRKRRDLERQIVELKHHVSQRPSSGRENGER